MNAPDLSRIKILGLDVDGTLTDGRIIVHNDGNESKHFSAHDGLGLSIFRRLGLEAVIVTGRVSHVVELRARDVGITEVCQGVKDKWPAFEAILEARGLAPDQAAFAGDDLVDLPVMTRVGLALAPSTARPEVRARAHFVTPSPAGFGAARDMVEFILKGQGRWDEALAFYLG